MPQEDWKYALTPPSYLLILPEDSVKSFFEKEQIENGQTSFLSDAYDEDTRTYSFPNLANLLKHQMENAPEEDMRLLVIPVERTTTSSGGGYHQTTVSTSALTNYMAPAGVKIRKDEAVMHIGITSCKYAR